MFTWHTHSHGGHMCACSHRAHMHSFTHGAHTFTHGTHIFACAQGTRVHMFTHGAHMHVFTQGTHAHTHRAHAHTFTQSHIFTHSVPQPHKHIDLSEPQWPHRNSCRTPGYRHSHRVSPHYIHTAWPGASLGPYTSRDFSRDTAKHTNSVGSCSQPPHTTD